MSQHHPASPKQSPDSDGDYGSLIVDSKEEDDFKECHTLMQEIAPFFDKSQMATLV